MFLIMQIFCLLIIIKTTFFFFFFIVRRSAKPCPRALASLSAQARFPRLVELGTIWGLPAAEVGRATGLQPGPAHVWLFKAHLRLSVAG